jgi:hypothetical protein
MGTGQVIATLEGVLDALGAGVSSDEVQHAVKGLPIYQRYAVLCSACYMRDKIAITCPERANSLGEIVTKNCPFYFSGRRTCPRPLVSHGSGGASVTDTV